MHQFKILFLSVALTAFAASAAEKGKPSGKAPAGQDAPVPQLPPIEPEPPRPPLVRPPDLPEIPDVNEWRVIDARSDPGVQAAEAAPEPAPEPAPPPEAEEGPRFAAAVGVSLAIPSADLDLSPSYSFEIGYSPSFSSRPGALVIGGRAGYALFKSERTVMVTGRGLDQSAYQASHFVPLAGFLRAQLPIGALQESSVALYVEAAGGVGLSVNEIHAFGSTDAAVGVSPEVGAAAGVDWRPTEGIQLLLFSRLRSSSVDVAGRASEAFLRSSLSSADVGLSVGTLF